MVKVFHIHIFKYVSRPGADRHKAKQEPVLANRPQLTPAGQKRRRERKKTKRELVLAAIIGKRIKQIRKSLGYKTQKEFALLLGRAPRAYSGYERGERKQPLEMLLLIAKLSKTDISQIISEARACFGESEARACFGEMV